jgi:hypothetical protein
VRSGERRVDEQGALPALHEAARRRASARPASARSASRRRADLKEHASVVAQRGAEGAEQLESNAA